MLLSLLAAGAIAQTAPCPPDLDTSICPPGVTPICGTEGDDVIFGTDGPDCIFGLGGDDQIFGLGGDDVLVGGDGDDLLDGGDGNDILIGGRGNNILIGGPGRDILISGGADGSHGKGEADWMDGSDRQGDAALGGVEDTCVNVSTHQGCGNDDALGAFTPREFQDGHALLFPDFNQPGFTVMLRLRDDAVWVDNRNDGANMIGTAYVSDLGGGPGTLGEEWRVHLKFLFRGIGPDGQGPDGPKIEQPDLQTPDLTNTWRYYDLVNGRMDRADGAMILLTQSMSFPFQVGFTADGKDELLGGSVWLSGQRQDSGDDPPRQIQGDYNVLLTVRGEDCSKDPAVSPSDVNMIRNTAGTPKLAAERYLCLESTGLYGQYPKPGVDYSNPAAYRAEYQERLRRMQTAQEVTDLPAFRVTEYGPQYPLWSDRLFKRRWVYLPDAVKVSDRDRWLFKPAVGETGVGTRFWKEFGASSPIVSSTLGKKDDPRAETRLIEKYREVNPNLPADASARKGDWHYAAYIWTEDHQQSLLWTEAAFTLNGSTKNRGTETTKVNVRGKRGLTAQIVELPHVVPSNANCKACHERGGDVILGFDYLQLSDRIDDHPVMLLSRGPGFPRTKRLAFFNSLNLFDPALTAAETSAITGPIASPIGYQTDLLVIADQQRAAIGYFHANCGHCHNPSASADSPAGLRLRWDSRVVPNEPPTNGNFDNSRQFAIQNALTFVSQGARAAIPGDGTDRDGDPDHSRIAIRMGIRPGGMPRIATQIIDVDVTQQPPNGGLVLIRTWIQRLRENGLYPID